MGKVRSSLACAGRVRGQTPKVAKRDKKKHCGRAYKHMHYNCCFIIAIVGVGKKREPNSLQK